MRRTLIFYFVSTSGMPEIYVIVVDSAKARVLHSTGKTSALVEYEILEHPEGRMHTRDLTSDLPGRDSNRTGLGKHRLDSSSDPKQQESIEFAKKLAANLESLITHKQVDQLMIVAAPGFLGVLRELLPRSVASVVTFELDKNLTHHKPDEIRTHLPYFKPVERLAT